jgi:putative FmdB family regulatory protein
MPIYEYECQKCHELTEIMQKMSDPPPAKCPSCGGKKMQRVMSQTSFQLKGEGWYITDYSRKDNEKKGAAKKDEGTSAPSSPPDSKTENKKDKKAAKVD